MKIKFSKIVAVSAVPLVNALPSNSVNALEWWEILFNVLSFEWFFSSSDEISEKGEEGTSTEAKVETDTGKALCQNSIENKENIKNNQDKISEQGLESNGVFGSFFDVKDEGSDQEFSKKVEVSPEEAAKILEEHFKNRDDVRFCKYNKESNVFSGKVKFYEFELPFNFNLRHGDDELVVFICVSDEKEISCSFYKEKIREECRKFDLWCESVKLSLEKIYKLVKTGKFRIDSYKKGTLTLAPVGNIGVKLADSDGKLNPLDSLEYDFSENLVRLKGQNIKAKSVVSYLFDFNRESESKLLDNFFNFITSSSNEGDNESEINVEKSSYIIEW